VDAASYVTHVCHHKCLFELKQQLEEKIQTEDFRLKCLKCVNGCRKEEMVTLPEAQQRSSKYVTGESRNGKCVTCSEFDVSYHAKLSSSMSQSEQKIQHMEETILDICNYPHRDSKKYKSFRECRFEIAKPFLAKAGIKEELEKGLRVFEWMR
jgi:hypothetical protein